MMNAQMMYDPQYVAARLAARRVQLAQEKEKPMAKRYSMTDEELEELRELIAGGTDEAALGAFAQRCNMHGSSMRAIVRSIRQELAVEEWAEALPVAEPVQAAPVVVAPPPTPPAAEVMTVAPAARIESIVDWLTALRAMRDELAQHGVRVEGRVSITVEL